MNKSTINFIESEIYQLRRQRASFVSKKDAEQVSRFDGFIKEKFKEYAQAIEDHNKNNQQVSTQSNNFNKLYEK